MEIQCLIECLQANIENQGRFNPYCEFAIEKVRRDPEFYLQYDGSSKSAVQIGEEIFRHFMDIYERLKAGDTLLRAHIMGSTYRLAFMDVLDDETGEPILDEFMQNHLHQEALQIGQAISSLNLESDGAAKEKKPAKPKAARGHVDQEAAFRGLANPAERLPDSYLKGLSVIQQVCLRLKLDHGLSPGQIALRLDRKKSTIQEILEAAQRRIEKRSQVRARTR